MADSRGRVPFGRLQASTIAKEGSVVSPPAKASVSRTAGPALQAAGPNRPPAADRFARPTLGKSRFAPAAAKPPGAEPARQASPQRPAHPNQQPQAPPAAVHRQQEQKVRFIAPPSRLPSPPAAAVALNPNKPAEPAATPAFGGFQSRLPRPGRATPAVKKPAASTAGATPAAALHGGTPETPNVLLWRPGGAADMVTPPAQRLAAGEQTFALSAEAPSSAASGDTPSTGGWSTEETPPFVGQLQSCIPRLGPAPASQPRMWFEETPEMPLPLDAGIDNDEDDAASDARADGLPSPPASFAFGTPAIGSAADGGSTAGGPASPSQPPEVTFAQLEAWREADRYLVDNPLAERGTPLPGANAATAAVPTFGDWSPCDDATLRAAVATSGGADPARPALLAPSGEGPHSAERSAAALGLFNLEEFCFGAVPPSFNDSTPGLILERSVGSPSDNQRDVEAWFATGASPCASTARFPRASGSPLPRLRLTPATPRFLPSVGLLATDERDPLWSAGSGAPTVISLGSPATESVYSCGSNGRASTPPSRFGMPLGFVLPTLKELAGAQSDSPLTAASSCSADHGLSASANRVLIGSHSRSASADSAAVVRLTPPVSAWQQAADPLCASPDSDQAYSNESADGRPQAPPPPPDSAAKPYLSMLRHLRGASYDSPNLGTAAPAPNDAVESPVTPKTTGGGGASIGASGMQQPTFDDSPIDSSPGASSGCSDGSPAAAGSPSDAGSPEGVLAPASGITSLNGALTAAGSPAAADAGSPTASDGPKTEPSSPADSADPLPAAGFSAAAEASPGGAAQTDAKADAAAADAAEAPASNGELAAALAEGGAFTAADAASPPARMKMQQATPGLDATPGRGSLESWMATTGLTDITTPAQRGLQAMWGAAGEVRALRSLVKRVAASELEIAAAEADEAAAHWTAMVEQSEAVAHDNEGLRAELARVQGELSALAAQQEAAARQQEAAAAAAAAELAALQRRSAGLAAQHEVEKQALCGELAAARQRLAEVAAAQDAAGAAADAHTEEDAAQSARAAELQAELQHAKEDVEAAHAAAEAAAADAADRTADMAAQLAAAQAAAAGAEQAAAETTALRRQTQQELPAGPPEAAAGDAAAATEAGPATAAEPGSRAAGADVAAAVADENASLRAQLAAALLQLAAATPRRAPRSPRNPQASPPGADSDMTATASPWSTSGDLPSAAAMHGNVDSTAAGDGSRGGSRFGGGVGPGSPPMSALRPFSLHLASPLGGFSPMRAGGYNSEYEGYYTAGEADWDACSSDGEAAASPVAAARPPPAAAPADAAAAAPLRAAEASSGDDSYAASQTSARRSVGRGGETHEEAPEPAAAASAQPAAEPEALPVPASAADSPASLACREELGSVSPQVAAVRSPTAVPAEAVRASPEAATAAAAGMSGSPSGGDSVAAAVGPLAQAAAAPTGTATSSTPDVVSLQLLNHDAESAGSDDIQSPGGLAAASTAVDPPSSPAARSPGAAEAAAHGASCELLPAAPPSAGASAGMPLAAEKPVHGCLLEMPEAEAPAAGSPATSDTAVPETPVAAAGPDSPMQASPLPEAAAPGEAAAPTEAASADSLPSVSVWDTTRAADSPLAAGSPAAARSPGGFGSRLDFDGVLDGGSPLAASAFSDGVTSRSGPVSPCPAADYALAVLWEDDAGSNAGAFGPVSESGRGPPGSGGTYSARTDADSPAAPRRLVLVRGSPDSEASSAAWDCRGRPASPAASDLPDSSCAAPTAGDAAAPPAVSAPELPAAAEHAAAAPDTLDEPPAGGEQPAVVEVVEAAAAAGGSIVEPAAKDPSAEAPAADAAANTAPGSPDAGSTAPTAATPWEPRPELGGGLSFAADGTSSGSDADDSCSAEDGVLPTTPGIPAVLPLSPGCTPAGLFGGISPAATTPPPASSCAQSYAAPEALLAVPTGQSAAEDAAAKADEADADSGADTAASIPADLAPAEELGSPGAAGTPPRSGSPTQLRLPPPQELIDCTADEAASDDLHPDSPAPASPASPGTNRHGDSPAADTEDDAEPGAECGSPAAAPPAAASPAASTPASPTASEHASLAVSEPASTASPASSAPGTPEATSPARQERSVSPSPGDIVRRGGVLGAIRHFDQRGFGAAPAPQPQPHLARSYFPQPAFHAATALAPLEAVTTPAPARGPAGEEADEALTPVSALAAILPGGSGDGTLLLLPPPLAMSPAGRPAAAGNVGPKPAGGWGGITARLQKLRADLRETQARLHTAEQMNFGGTPSPQSTDYATAAEALTLDGGSSPHGGGGTPGAGNDARGAGDSNDDTAGFDISGGAFRCAFGGSFSGGYGDSPPVALGLGSPIDESSPDRSPSPVAGLVESPSASAAAAAKFAESPTFSTGARDPFSLLRGRNDTCSGGPAASGHRASAAASSEEGESDGCSGGGSARGGGGSSRRSHSSGAPVRWRRRRAAAQSLTFAPLAASPADKQTDAEEATAQLVAWAAARIKPLAALAAAAATGAPAAPPTFDLSAADPPAAFGGAGTAAPTPTDAKASSSEENGRSWRPAHLPAAMRAAATAEAADGASSGCTPWPAAQPRPSRPYTVGREPPRLVEYDSEVDA